MNIKVVAAIVESKGKVLVAKRKADDELCNRWEFPGGKIREGETPEQCLKREIKEELGIDIEVGEFITSSTFTYPHISIELVAYFAKWRAGNIKTLVHDKLKWVYPHELLRYNFADADLPIVKKLTKRPKFLTVKMTNDKSQTSNKAQNPNGKTKFKNCN